MVAVMVVQKLLCLVREYSRATAILSHRIIEMIDDPGEKLCENPAGWSKRCHRQQGRLLRCEATVVLQSSTSKSETTGLLSGEGRSVAESQCDCCSSIRRINLTDDGEGGS